MRRITQIIYHQAGHASDTVESITRWHTTAPPNGMGWPHIGYGYVLTPDAVVHKTLDNSQVGFHCRGDNAHSIGICCVGALSAFPLDKGYMSMEMFKALLELTQALKLAYPTIGSALWGHREKPSGIEQAKLCPGWEVGLLRALV